MAERYVLTEPAKIHGVNLPEDVYFFLMDDGYYYAFYATHTVKISQQEVEKYPLVEV